MDKDEENEPIYLHCVIKEEIYYQDGIVHKFDLPPIAIEWCLDRGIDPFNWTSEGLAVTPEEAEDLVNLIL